MLPERQGCFLHSAAWIPGNLTTFVVKGINCHGPLAMISLASHSKFPRQGLPLDLLFRIWQLSVSVTKEAASLAFAETKLSINSVLDSPPSMLVQNALDDLKSW
jgi:hypothetical protein